MSVEGEKKVKKAKSATTEPKKSKSSKDKLAESSSPPSIKKAGKRKVAVVELAEQVVEKKSKKQKKSIEQSSCHSSDSEDTTVVAVPPSNPNALDNFPLSDGVKSLLRSKGIESLFDIQAATLQHCVNGFDCVGRARTGCGKTLAFVLPIVEKLLKEDSGSKKQWGRAPRVLVLTPTRELAKQVHQDFEFIGKAGDVSTLCLYGGTAYDSQNNKLRKGVDVIVGTPGRVKDHLERGTLKLNKLMYRVLDECDEMLNMGFVEDVEKILGYAEKGATMQTMLFSATLPKWVKDITKRFLRPDHKFVDLVGTDKMKASTSVRHLMLPCHWSQRSQIVSDVVKCYAGTGRTIVFTDTKNDANDLSSTLSKEHSARPLHGDIPQGQREVTLAGFRGGKFNVLVATDVAARGLDISGVDLVLQTEPPKDPETYIHRSGRTGRAGCSGVSITFVDRKKEWHIPQIEKQAGVVFERIGAPQPADMANMAAEQAVEAVKAVDGSAIEYFRKAAQKLLQAMGSPEEAVAAALAKITGNTEMKSRSLLTAHEEYTTLLFTSPQEVQKPGYVFGFLKRRLPEDKVEEVKRMSMAADGKRAVFDVPSNLVKEFLSACGRPVNNEEADESSSLARGSSQEPFLTLALELPELKEQNTFGSSYGGSPGGYGFQGGRGGGRFSSGGGAGRFTAGKAGYAAGGRGGGRGRGRGFQRH